MKKQQEKYSPYDIGKQIFIETNAKHIKVEDVCTNEKDIELCNKSKTIENEVLNTFNMIKNDGFIITNEVHYFLSTFFSNKKCKYDNLCEAGVATVTIDDKGELWSCQLFIGKSEYNMGNIYCYNENKFKNVMNTLNKFRICNFEDCKQCAARCYCTRCLGTVGILENKKLADFKSFGSSCEYRREIVYKTLDTISDIIKKDEFKSFNDYIGSLLS